MKKEWELWRFVAERLSRGENAMLLVVVESSGSSPGRQGYKMAVGADGELVGSIGGGVMEVALVEQSRKLLSELGAGGFSLPSLTEQVHQRNSPQASGMICSGKQTVIFKLLTKDDRRHVIAAARSIERNERGLLQVTSKEFSIGPLQGGTRDFAFERLPDKEFAYRERLGAKHHLYIVGGGHCALALSELMSKMDFHIGIFDDRPELNTLQKNEFADEIKIVESYDRIAEHIPSSDSTYIAVMTLGYQTDAVVIRSLINKEFKYFGVLGSKAKMATLIKELKGEGLPSEKLDRIHTPIGLPINSRTPEEIAVSIAAEIISVKNESPQ